MGRKREGQRNKRFKVTELAMIFGMHRNTMAKRITEERVDLSDAVDTVNLIKHLLGERGMVRLVEEGMRVMN